MSEERSEKIKRRIKEWFSERWNLYFFAVLAVSLIVRLYFFTLTKTQPMWWDEAEYALRAKTFAFGTPITGWAAEREIIVPLIFAIFFKIGFGEIMLRLLQVFVSVSTIFMTYLVASELLSRRVGFFASFGMTFFWLHIFFTQRVLLYLWVPLIYLGIIHFFYKGYVKGDNKYLIAFAVLSSIGLYTYFSIGFLLLGIFCYLLYTEKIGLFMNRKAWKVFAIFVAVLLPYMIYAQATYGFPIPRLKVGYKATSQEFGAGLSGLTAYVNMFPSRVGWIFTLLIFGGAIYFLGKFLLGFGIKGNLDNNRKGLIAFLGFFFPLLLYTLYGVVGGSGTFYDAFILGVFPFGFMFGGVALDKIYEVAKKYNKHVAIGVIVILLGMHANYGLKTSDFSIKGKISSYDSVKEAGLWLKEHSREGDVIISASAPQNTYYSERETWGFGSSAEELDAFISEKRPKYLVDSVWEPVEPWTHQYAVDRADRMKPVKIYYFNQQQPSLVIYEIVYS